MLFLHSGMGSDQLPTSCHVLEETVLLHFKKKKKKKSLQFFKILSV